MRSYDLDGKLLWTLRGMSSITIAMPYAADGLLYVSSGYVGDRIMKSLYAIKPGASGDITPPEGQRSSEFIAWWDPGIAPYNPTALVHQGKLYVLYDRGLLSCFDAKTGQPFYLKERLPRGPGFTTSPWAMGDKLFCLDEDGQTSVLRPGASSSCSTPTPSEVRCACPHLHSSGIGCSSARTSIFIPSGGEQDCP